MGGSYRRYEIISQSSPFSPFFISETTSIFPSKPPLSLLNPPFHFEDNFLDLLNPNPNPTPFSLLDFPDLIQIESETTPFCSHKRLIRRFESPESHYLKALCDRVSSLESKFDRALEGKKREEKKKKKALKLSEVDRKYSYTAEIKGGVERKYQWKAEIEGVDEKKGKRGERKYQWSTEIKEKGDDDREKRIYTWKATIGGEKEKKKKDEVKKKKEEKKGSGEARIVEIEDEPDHRAVVLRQAFAKRALTAKDKGKKKEISPEDAAVRIQVTFRGYLIRRSQVLRALRELAVAKSKLKELRTKFHNFSYRSHIARDAEERQKFSEKIIVLLLTVDSIEGVDMMVRAAKRSMVDELEAMLEVVDPQPAKRSLSMRRRMFDMPSGGIQKEIAEGVAQVVQMLNEEENGTFV